MMQRTLEPELMTDNAQVRAYAAADFAIPHNHFIDLIAQHQQQGLTGPALDLGCGPGDVTRRFAVKFNTIDVDAVDGSEAMLVYARAHLPLALQQRVRYIHGYLPDQRFSSLSYLTIISNSLLHHLPDPAVLWQTIKHYAGKGAGVYIMDLLRPDTSAQARQMILTYAADEPEILQTDFYNSLLAAFTLAEIQAQLDLARLSLSVKQVSDRHLFIYGNV